MPLEWIDFKEAVRVYHLGQVAYTCGVSLYHIHGGHNAVTGRRSVIEINSIIPAQPLELDFLAHHSFYVTLDFSDRWWVGSTYVYCF